MDSRSIKKLVDLSYKNNQVDEKKIEKIANLLTRFELKQYLKEMKIREKKKNVVISLPYLPKRDDQKKIQQLFPSKKIIYVIDPSLLVGMKVLDNDLITEFNLKKTLDNLIFYLGETYD